MTHAIIGAAFFALVLAAAAAQPLELNDSNFHATLDGLDSVVAFTASWCGFCKALYPVLDELASVAPGHVSIVKVDVPSNAALAAEFEVRSMPTIVVFVRGMKHMYPAANERTAGAIIDFYLKSGGSTTVEPERISGSQSSIKRLAQGVWFLLLHPLSCDVTPDCRKMLDRASVLAGRVARDRARVGLIDVDESSSPVRALGIAAVNAPAFVVGSGKTWKLVPAADAASPETLVRFGKPHMEAAAAVTLAQAAKLASIPRSFLSTVHTMTQSNMGSFLGLGVPVLFVFTMESSEPARSTVKVMELLSEMDVSVLMSRACGGYDVLPAHTRCRTGWHCGA